MELAAQYDTIEGDLLEPAATLESGRLTRTSGQAADAHIALLNAIEAAVRERAELAVPFDTPDAPHAIATDRWPALEKALLDDFGRTASADLKGRLYAALLQHPGLVVRTTRETLASFVEVSARVEDGVLEVTIADDGVGGADLGHGSGLIGLVDRLEAIGGRLRVTGPPGEGTTLVVRLPLPRTKG
ncbi:hypothetical protein ACWDG9_15600 [Streptomyces sp. NPDC001073]